MTDITQLLDGTVEDVKNGLSGLSAKDLNDLLAAEQTGKKRKGVIDALEEASTEAALADTHTGVGDREDAATTASTDISKAAAVATASSTDMSGPANIEPATAFETSGAPIQTTEIDASHPAVDNNPRANTTAEQNRIDFNDPIRTGEEIVKERLKNQSAD